MYSRSHPSDCTTDPDRPAAWCRLPDDHEAFAGWLHHRDGGRAGAWSGLGRACLSYDAPEDRTGRVDRIAEVDKTPAPAVSERRSPPIHRTEDRGEKRGPTHIV